MGVTLGYVFDDSWPVSRIVLGIDGMILFAMRLDILHPRTETSQSAQVFLQSLCPEALLQLAMMADIGDEALILIRELDNEDAMGGVVRVAGLIVNPDMQMLRCYASG